MDCLKIFRNIVFRMVIPSVYVLVLLAMRIPIHIGGRHLSLF